MLRNVEIAATVQGILGEPGSSLHNGVIVGEVHAADKSAETVESYLKSTQADAATWKVTLAFQADFAQGG